MPSPYVLDHTPVMPQALLLLAISYAALITTAGVAIVVSGAPPPPPAPERSNNCPDKCGAVHIPYPFGVGPECSLNQSFALTCNETTNPPSLFTGNVKVANITLETAQMVAYTHLTYSCNVPFGNGSRQLLTQSMAFSVASPFLLSPSDNVFTALGCRSTARLKGRSEDPYLTGCITTCERVNDTGDDGAPCRGHGCCEASLTPGLRQVSMSWNTDEQGQNPVPDNPCQYAFVATKGWYNYRKTDLTGNMTFANGLGEGNVVPIVLDWAIRDGTCPAPEGGGKESISYGACVSTSSYCVNASDGATGYFCNCSKGYTGNPYMKNGCKNIDECALRRSPNSTVYANMYPCRGGTCHDREGDYECKCKFGRRGDGKSDRGCEPILSTPAIAAIGAVSAFALLSVLLIFLQMEREKRKLRERFNKNGGQILKSIKIEIFTKEKLDHMTNNYSCAIGRGAFGQVYKGTTGAGDGTSLVAVKRSIAIQEDRQKESFANEITIQSKISHRNLVQLLGCCLETEVPMLVYEFVPRGSLQDVLHGNNDPLPLETRLTIAIYSAIALAYMHSEASQRTIVLHGDVKSGNILLDEDFTPKVSDFGTSRLMSMDKNHTNWVIGDSSYIDPVYMKTGLLTEKSDVYSFGIVLLEIITRKKARYDGNKSLPLDYVKASVDGTAREMLDKEIVAGREENVKCLEEVGRIAVRCLEDEVDDRPSMSEVADRLKVCKSQWLTAKPCE